MTDVLAALGWMIGALALVGLLVWAALRGKIRDARAQRDAQARGSRDSSDTEDPKA